MEDTIVLYTIPEHLISSTALAKFITKHHSISITILSTAAISAVESLPPLTTYRQIAAVEFPPNLPPNPVERIFEIHRLHNAKLIESLEEISKKSKIRAMVIDFFCYSALDEASKKLNIPTYFDISGGAFSLCAFLYFPTMDETLNPREIGDFNDFLQIPGCPLIHSSDFPSTMLYRKSNTYKHFLDAARNMRKSNGILVNAFDALEFRAKSALTNGLCVPNGPTPPFYLLSPSVAKINAQNGAVSHHHDDDDDECLTWLDSQPSKSVIFLCFGRWGTFSAKQLKEIAFGLEKSCQRFLWSVATNEEELGLDALLPEGFLDRTKETGLVMFKKWVPQKEVLSHNAVGGFVTHCGWNSVLEAVSFGVPMIGWPLYAEQRMNRVFMVEEMRVTLPLDMEADGFVKAAELERRVRELMEGKALRHKMAEMKVSATAAVREGGSSVVDLHKFIDSVTN